MDDDEGTERDEIASDAEAPSPVVSSSVDQASDAGPGSENAVPSRGEVKGRYPFIYALGRIEPRFPGLALQKEFAQVSAHTKTAGLTDGEVFQCVLTDAANRYLARQMCWILTIEGVETYIVTLVDPTDLDVLLETVRAAPNGLDVDVVIGVRGPIAPPEACGGLVLPLVACHQIYSFDRNKLVASIPRPSGIPAKDEKAFRSAAGEVFDRIMQMADNAGSTDEDRAVNYLALRYPAIYARAAEAHAQNYSLSGVEARRSRLRGVRNIMDVVFSYTHRETDVTEGYFARVDVTEEFPFLVTKLARYYPRYE